MEFNLSTFGLEIANFLVLIWILQRLFYKPLQAIIAKRKQAIEQTLLDAETVRQKAQQECETYENRQQAWEQEKQAASTIFHQRLDAERATHLTNLQRELEQERQINQVTLEREKQEFQHYAQQQALKNAAKFAGVLLQQTVTPELEVHLAQLLLERLTTFDFSLSSGETVIKVSSVYPISAEFQQQLEERFATLISAPLTFDYQQDANLIAGLRIELGSWVLNANLKHELSGFAELAYELE
jgi:F-type H+-transporting ATPase subunit b